jgi:hypothetical protein
MISYFRNYEEVNLSALQKAYGPDAVRTVRNGDFIEVGLRGDAFDRYEKHGFCSLCGETGHSMYARYDDYGNGRRSDSKCSLTAIRRHMIDRRAERGAVS